MFSQNSNIFFIYLLSLYRIAASLPRPAIARKVFRRNIRFKSHGEERRIRLNCSSVDGRRISPPASEWTQSGNSFLPFTLNIRPHSAISPLQTRRLVSSLMTGRTLFHRAPFPRRNYRIFRHQYTVARNWTVVAKLTSARRTSNWRTTN